MFTLGFKDAREIGVDYRDYVKVRKLPEGITLTAVLGVWGDYSDLRVLFTANDSKQYCRTVFHGTKYYIPELDVFGKDIEIGQAFKT